MVERVAEGRDYIGVGVGAMVFNADGQVFLAKRGSQARNESEHWEFPGGGVLFGERLTDAIRREFLEEYGMTIQIEELLSVFDHILTEEGQHWISITYIASHIEGTPVIREPEKCSAIGWFSPAVLPAPLSQITRDNLAEYNLAHTHEAIL